MKRVVKVCERSGKVAANLLSMAVVLFVVIGMSGAPPVWGMYAKDAPYMEQSRGHILYLPTINHADTSVDIQAPSGIIPTSPRSKVATAEDTAGRMLELAAAYRYTGDERYNKALRDLWSALDQVKWRYRFYPEIVGIDGTAYSIEKGDEVIHDAIFLSKAMLGEETIESYVTATREIAVEGYVEAEGGECIGEGCPQEEEAGSCPYEGYGEEGEKRLKFVCAEGYSTLLEVEYSVPLDKLDKDINVSDIAVANVKYRGEEIGVDEGGMRGIGIELKPYARKDMLRAVAEEHLEDAWIRRGFSAEGITEYFLRIPKAKLGYQARMILLGEESPPWNIVRYGKESQARNYMKLTEEYSLLKGAVYLPGLTSINSTLYYEFGTKEKLDYAYSNDLNFKGRKAVYLHQGDTPKFEGITVEYRPVRYRRIHVAGTMESLLEAKFGASAEVLGYVETKELASGVYNITAKREKVLEEENLEGKVYAWKPSNYRDAKVVQFATLGLLKSEQLFKEAIREQDPEKFYLAADNLKIYSPRGNVRQAMLAMLSLDPREAEKLASALDGDPTVASSQVMRVFEEFREWYAQETLDRARAAVLKSLQDDEYSVKLEEVLMYLSLEAERVELPTSQQMKDLYEGYKAYFGPDTKDYESLARMAKQIPEYQGIVDAIEDGDYARAKEMISALPAGKPKDVFFQKVSEEERRLSTLKSEVIEALKSGDYDRATKLATEYEELGQALGAGAPEVSIMKGVAASISLGKLSEDEGRKMLSALEAFSEWKVEEAPETRPYEPIPPETPYPQKGSNAVLLCGVIVVVLALVVVVVIAVKRRKGKERAGRR